MPELPEVETIARKLRPELVGKSITKADLLWSRTLATPSPAQFNKWIKGQEIKAVGRRAKYVHIQLSEYHLFVHLRMSGDLYIKEGKTAPEKHDRLILSLTPNPSPTGREEFPPPPVGEGTGVRESKLVFNDTRKFGRVWLVRDLDEVIGGLGPEPLSDEFTAEMLYENLQSRHRQLKPLLLDQAFLAGMGNIYTDEALHMARLHPLAASDSVNREQAQALWEAIRAVLQEGIRRNGASIDWVYRGGEFQNYFRVYDRKGLPCPVCGTEIERSVIGQRGTHVCPNCQRIRS
ncbi:MAG: bifunctional DNA-formamidopyrimidine glycosylase/DNA-(apurinic or apyrimidinic site) lyase [Anaerolineales bacterium]|nr:bifunctional DNA-formamidopyrimidine glycosylase/DNA-(apurinic or apyrimidinic site) lyase [Anaerolineales bacterium]